MKPNDGESPLTGPGAETLNQLLLDSLPYPAMLIRSDRTILAANRVAREAGAVVGGICWRDFRKSAFAPATANGNREEPKNPLPRSAPCSFCQADQTLTSGEPSVARQVRVAGRIWDEYWVPLEPDLFLHYAIDTTDQHRIRDRLLAAERAKAISSLARGVAHHLNNTLAVILATASVLQREIPRSSPIAEDIDSMAAAAASGGAVLKSLMALARPNPARRDLLDLNQTVKGITEILSRSAPSGVFLRTELEQILPRVECDAAAIGHLVMSLCENAIDAVEDGGTIVVATSSRGPDDEPPPELPSAPGGYVLLEVVDSGIGMATRVAGRALEPFFTAKEKNHNLGLGLAIVRTTAEVHGGAVLIDTAPGRGTTVRVWLPAAVPSREDIEPTSSDVAVNGKKRIVLVVDDWEPARRTTGRLVDSLGYRTILGTSGADALRILKERPDEVDAVLLDLSMPDMNGDECFNRIKVIAPALPVLIFTGVGPDARVDGLMEDGVAGVLQKPVAYEELAAALRGLWSRSR